MQKLRDQLFVQQTLCVVCQQQGRVTIATIRDHIINLAEGGCDVETNTQALCAACHRVKTQAEAQRGRSRSRYDDRNPRK